MHVQAGVVGQSNMHGVRGKDRVALGSLDKNVLERRSDKRTPPSRGASRPRTTPLAPKSATQTTYLTPKLAHNRGLAPTSARSHGSGSSSSLTPKSSPGSPMEVTPAPSSPASQHATPFRVPSLTPRMKETRHILPPQAMEHHGKLTVVFDLDETLVSNRRPGSAPAIARHYLKHMCRLLEGLVEVVLWTASTEETGRPVVRQIDPTGTFFHHVVFRNNKWFTDGVHTKDLTLLGRDMDRVLIVENTPNCCKLNPQNAIMVEDFVGDLRYVMHLAHNQDHFCYISYVSLGDFLISSQ